MGSDATTLSVQRAMQLAAHAPTQPGAEARGWSRLVGRRGGQAQPSVSQLEDTQLVALAGPERDPAAFAELVRRHQSKVRGLLLRLSSDRTLADDLAQEVFLRAYRGLEGFEGRARFSTWLYRITYNVFLNHRSRSKELAALPEGFEQRAAAPEGRLSAVRSDLRRDLAAAIETLPERYRAVIVLYYLEEVSYPEIAEILELPLGTVKTHLFRAKRLLRQELGAWDGQRD